MGTSASNPTRARTVDRLDRDASSIARHGMTLATFDDPLHHSIAYVLGILWVGVGPDGVSVTWTEGVRKAHGSDNDIDVANLTDTARDAYYAAMDHLATGGTLPAICTVSL